MSHYLHIKHEEIEAHTERSDDLPKVRDLIIRNTSIQTHTIQTATFKHRKPHSPWPDILSHVVFALLV